MPASAELLRKRSFFAFRLSPSFGRGSGAPFAPNSTPNASTAARTDCAPGSAVMSDMLTTGTGPDAAICARSSTPRRAHQSAVYASHSTSVTSRLLIVCVAPMWQSSAVM